MYRLPERDPARYTYDMKGWDRRRDELDRTVFAGQLTIDGEEQAETVVKPKKAAARGTEGSSRAASSFAGEDSRTDGDTPMFEDD